MELLLGYWIFIPVWVHIYDGNSTRLKMNYYAKKWGGLGRNEIMLKLIIGTHGNWKIRILGAVLELPARQHYQSSPFTSKIDQIDRISSAV